MAQDKPEVTEPTWFEPSEGSPSKGPASSSRDRRPLVLIIRVNNLCTTPAAANATDDEAAGLASSTGYGQRDASVIIDNAKSFLMRPLAVSIRAPTTGRFMPVPLQKPRMHTPEELFPCPPFPSASVPGCPLCHGHDGTHHEIDENSLCKAKQWNDGWQHQGGRRAARPTACAGLSPPPLQIRSTGRRGVVGHAAISDRAQPTNPPSGARTEPQRNGLSPVC